MKLEDAFLYFVADLSGMDPEGAVGMCSDAIAGGADVIQLRGEGVQPAAGDILRVCREEEALLVIGQDASAAVDLGADGVHLDSVSDGIGQARAIIGMDSMVGVSSNTLEDAQLALEIGVDYVIHCAGTRCSGDLAGIGAGAGVPLFAGGIDSFADAGQLVESGVFRLCVESRTVGDGAVRDQVASFARLIGRSI